MLTSVRLSRLWQTARYRRLMRDVLAGRPEGGLRLDERLGGPLAAAALGLLRMAELNQAGLPLAREMADRLLMCQNRDGSFGDAPADRPPLTALCARALGCLDEARPGRFVMPVGFGLSGFGADQPKRDSRPASAVARAIAWLGASQHVDGGWGNESVGEGEGADAFATGFVLLQLGRLDAFRRQVRIDRALEVGRRVARDRSACAETKLVWSRLRPRCGRALTLVGTAQAASEARRRRAEEFAFAEVA